MIKIKDIDQEKLQQMVISAEAVSAQYSRMSDRMSQLKGLVTDAESHLHVERENQRNAHPAFPSVPARIRGFLDQNPDKKIEPFSAQDYSHRVKEAQERLDQLLNEKATLPEKMSAVGARNIQLATTLREINRSLITAGVRVVCLEKYS